MASRQPQEKLSFLIKKGLIGLSVSSMEGLEQRNEH